MRFKSALTLIELLLVAGLISVLAVPAVLNLSRSRSARALQLAGENFANGLRTARIYSRSERDDRAWGIRFSGSNSFALISGLPDSFKVEKNFQLEPPAAFVNSFADIWFIRATGGIADERVVDLGVPSGMSGRISVNKAGIVKFSLN